MTHFKKTQSLKFHKIADPSIVPELLGVLLFCIKNPSVVTLFEQRRDIAVSLYFLTSFR